MNKSIIIDIFAIISMALIGIGTYFIDFRLCLIVLGVIFGLIAIAGAVRNGNTDESNQ